ncbi:MAG: hypothetical protein IPN07_14815 [Dehalococcoidia bacterium]|nr:hypothetical protein [Dehalococcoidia bacterium]
MHDVDLLIRPPGFMKAAGALLNAGWQPLRGDREDYFRRVRVFHALPLASPDSVEVDLHRYMLEENCWPDVDASLFEQLANRKTTSSTPVSTGPVGTRCLRYAGSSTPWSSCARRDALSTGSTWSTSQSGAGSLCRWPRRSRFAADYEPSIPRTNNRGTPDSAGGPPPAPRLPCAARGR